MQAAGTRGGDFLWPLPMTDDYKELLKSDIADMVNAAGTRYGGAVSAALFLKAFSGDTRGRTSTSPARPGPTSRSRISPRARQASPYVR